MKQKEVFMQGEADAWFERNRHMLKSKNIDSMNPVISVISEILSPPNDSDERVNILEIGCREGKRLAWLSENFNAKVYGIDPSEKAVKTAKLNGVKAERGTADELPFTSASFDIVIFGFCLYLCDRQDLFRIAQEADRVIKQDGWVIIHDFFASAPVRHAYHHKPGLYSFKMDYRTLFDWHPDYTCYHHNLTHHGKTEYCDDPQEWVATSVLRKKTDHDN